MPGNTMPFEWDAAKEKLNIKKHGVSFRDAMSAFDDPLRVIRPDISHSKTEIRLYCFGLVDGEVMTVRFTMRGKNIRIIGAAYWRKGKEFYAQKDTL